ncbi:TetR/AcrR family transcriptional regulator [Pseudonocardia oroxyli]|uniref:Transcriptional regulator, TetR family n=1 Tax=Pseudonocardia oroxyli TaxID=366584 RepID=A0A1G8EUH5_PSEOR|nr:TetR/AcrR family transcriptional regulator [Pseudonocardia oroxyli]SDH73528.1 transcriptional regulator, TetR family [Pseudonocardia oroxyli]
MTDVWDTPTPGRRGRPPLSDAQRERQRLEISRHAVALFRAQGLAATSGAQIAHAAGVSERTVWRLFRSKEACVEPLLRSALEEFQEVLRAWPADRGLVEHLRAEYRAAGPEREDVLAVVRMTREERALRAVWLLLQESAEATLTEVFARRLGLAEDSLEARTRAAVVNAALRIATDDLADSGARESGLAEVLRLAVGPY